MSSILHKHKTTGFGLIEVLVSTVVIALGLLAIASMLEFLSSLTSTHHSFYVIYCLKMPFFYQQHKSASTVPNRV